MSKKTAIVVKLLVIGGAAFVGYYALTKFAPSMTFTTPNGASNTSKGSASTTGNFQTNTNSSNYAPVVTSLGQHVDNTAVEVGAIASLGTTAMQIFGGGGDGTDGDS